MERLEITRSCIIFLGQIKMDNNINSILSDFSNLYCDYLFEQIKSGPEFKKILGNGSKFINWCENHAQILSTINTNDAERHTYRFLVKEIFEEKYIVFLTQHQRDCDEIFKNASESSINDHNQGIKTRIKSFVSTYLIDIIDYLCKKVSAKIQEDNILYLSARSLVINDSTELMREIEKTAEPLQNKISELREELQSTVNTATNDIIKKAHETNITILGIFSAVVLTVAGGFSLSSAALKNLSSASVYRVLAAIFSLGLIFINILAILITYLERVRCGKGYKSNYILVVITSIIIAALICYFVLMERIFV